MNMGVSEPLLFRSNSGAVAKRYAAKTRPEAGVMVPYLVLTACAASGLLVCAQEVVPALNCSSAQQSLRPDERL